MKKLITPALLLTVLLALAACGSSPEPEETGIANMGNPWVDCADLEEAADLAGFRLQFAGKQAQHSCCGDPAALEEQTAMIAAFSEHPICRVSTERQKSESAYIRRKK